MFKQRFLDSAIQQHITLFAGERSTFHAGAEWIIHHFRDESHYAEREDIYPFAPNDAHERLGDQPFDRVQNRFDGSEQRTAPAALGGTPAVTFIWGMCPSIPAFGTNITPKAGITRCCPG